MSLVFCAIVPHSPILIPSIGKENLSKLHNTVLALDEISKKMEASKPETVIIITNHHQPLGINNPKAIIFNIRPNYKLGFEEFGEYGESFVISGDSALAYHLKHRFDTLREKYQIILTSEEKIDSSLATVIPYLLKRQSRLRFVPLSDTIENGKPEFVIGEKMRLPIYQEKKRIAVVAVANLSHRHNQSPAGFSPRAKLFDQRILSAIAKKQPMNLARFKLETLAEVKECAIRPLLLLFGILKNTNYKAELLSYENPFGIGHTVINLSI